MRLWHTKLIKVLPKMHLQAQWRELSAIAGAIEKNGTPNHMLFSVLRLKLNLYNNFVFLQHGVLYQNHEMFHKNLDDR